MHYYYYKQILVHSLGPSDHQSAGLVCLHKPLICPHCRHSGFPSRLNLTPPAPNTGLTLTLVGSDESLSCIGKEVKGWIRLEDEVDDELRLADDGSLFGA